MTIYYQKHIFFCTNLKEQGKKCCSLGGSRDAVVWAKDFLIKNDMWGPGKFRVSTSGCMGRCALGPIVVIYPEACWYTFQNKSDIEAIIWHHISSNEVFKRGFLA
ncbi:MAG: (2Fe-2S) ferredoxin domain-containing protein [Francisellaceae bacterium]|jgi:(2Fe-2S) ferredoxin|nr:(2Fe-2S) ferredoxin domain-containing protein [Francisellaceae bacterium]MBT6206432.1 (2Fe-2S) ferredoxin domain-containing protein [Francisellaceae bacterium]MBT6537909.1 (2Fe-2S) ferredoxin domain-containing protein [Francisellaceae bacterium]